MQYRTTARVTAGQFTRDRLEAYLFSDVPLPIGFRIQTVSFNKAKRTIGNSQVTVATAVGEVHVYPGDWIVTESDGVTRYLLTAQEFQVRYEPMPACEAEMW
jgi:regulator of RNase E activity RraA